MSKSRLEKFLYALYSLDYSDLPKPLSRIEELYSCLVTGDEAPTFEPLSRVEKYLMAILGGYDVELLPNPLSRVEVLLYKLATGDDNLDDIDSFLSEHEELLAEIIRNGGVGGNIDIEYVLYTLSTEFNTLYNTAEKPIKSAILKGQTLVNLVGEKRFYTNHGTSTILKGWEFMLPYNLTKGKTYLAVFNATGSISSTNSKVYLMDNNFGSNTGNTANPAIFEVGYNMVKCVASGDNHRVLRIRTQVESSDEFKVSDAMLIEYQDGMENWDIPYFEGMKSVQMPVLKTTGKNLFHGKIEWGSYSSTTTQKVTSDKTRCRSSVVPLIPDGFKGKARISENFQFYIRLFEDGRSVKESGFCTVYTLDNTSNTFNEVTIVIRKVDNTTITDDELATIKIQIEEGSKETEYEPHKSNILMVNEEVELRGIGDVKDELNLLTGELTQKIGEVVFDGNETWGLETVDTLTSRFFLKLDEYKSVVTNVGIPFMNDEFPFKFVYDIDNEGIFSQWAGFYLRIANEKLGTPSVVSLQTYLAQNPITMHYQLLKPTIKTVDLSVVDQNEDNTKLSTFNDITHVTLSSEGLIPEAELEVATKNEEVLNTMNLEMNDISKTQNDLQETLDIQSENVDSTMIATTEIYEGLL